MSETLDSLRKRIDETDRELTRLFNTRLDLTDEVAREKRRVGSAVKVPARESAIIEEAIRNSPETHSNEVRTLYTKIFEISRERQQRIIEE